MHDKNLTAALAEIKVIIDKYDLFAQVFVQSAGNAAHAVKVGASWTCLECGTNDEGAKSLRFSGDPADHLRDGQLSETAQNSICAIMTASEMLGREKEVFDEMIGRISKVFDITHSFRVVDQ